jgi:hypothetical protein
MTTRREQEEQSMLHRTGLPSVPAATMQLKPLKRVGRVLGGIRLGTRGWMT